MNILFYFGGFAPLGGIETSARNLLSELKRRNFHSGLVCWGGGSSLLEDLGREGVHVRRVSWRWGCRYNLPDWLMLLAAVRALRRADVVLFGKLVPTKLLHVLRRLAARHVRFILITAYRPLFPKEEKKRRIVHAQYQPYDRIWVQSSLFETDLRALGYQKRVDVIPYMPEPTQPAEPFPKAPIRIGFLGRLVADKNIPLLLEAFNLFRKSWSVTYNGEPALELYGDGCLRSELEAQVSQLDLGAYVRFHGGVPQQRVAQVVATRHLFVFTSRVEGQCLAALEILRCGRPIVATSAGAFPEILQDSELGRLVKDSAAVEIAKAIEQVAALIVGGEVTPVTVQSAYKKSFDAGDVGERYARLLNDME